MNKKLVEVVAAVIENENNEILCALRSPIMTLPNMWEFPGGKVEEGESLYTAIEREIKEELKRKDLKEEERKSLEEELKDGVNVKLEDTDKVNASYLRKAIKELNPKITDEKIDSYKESYKSFAWAVAVAPADDPEIAVVAMIPQGESSSNAMLLIREVLGSYFDLDNNKGEKNNKNDENTGTIEKENINFVSQMKK